MVKLLNVLVGLLLVVGIASRPQAVLAQAATAPVASPAQPPAQAPDIVRLRDGTLYRGVLGEVIPGSHSSILLVTGEVRRFAAKDVAYAGPANQEPAKDAPVATADKASVAGAPARASDDEADGPDIDWHAPKTKLAQEAGIVLGVGLPVGVGLLATGVYKKVKRTCEHLADAPEVCPRGKMTSGVRAEIIFGSVITALTIGIATYLLHRRHRLIVAERTAAPAREPKKEDERAQLEPVLQATQL